MNHLKRLSSARQRYGRVRDNIAAYWLDQLVEQMMRGRQQQIAIAGKVAAVLRDPSGEELIIPGLNIVTNDGDQYYAQVAAGETPTDDFTAGGLRLGSSNVAPTKTDTDVTTFLAGSGHAEDVGYPQTNDPDGDNSGAGVDIVTWRFSYTTGEGNVSNIIEGAIVDNITTPTAALTHFLFAATFSKTSSDTLKCFINHQMNGV